jgi:hypothetical protein
VKDIWEQLALGADISMRQLDALRDALPESQAEAMVNSLDDNERRAALKLGLTAPLLAEFYGGRSDEEIAALVKSLQDSESGPLFTRNKVIGFTRANKGYTPNELFRHLTRDYVAPKYSGDIYTHPGCADLRVKAENFFTEMERHQRAGEHAAVANGLREVVPGLQTEFAQRAKELNLAPITGVLPGASLLYGEASESSS